MPDVGVRCRCTVWVTVPTLTINPHVSGPLNTHELALRYTQRRIIPPRSSRICWHRKVIMSQSLPKDQVGVVTLVRGEEKYVFVFQPERRTELLRLLGRYAADPNLSFSWYDAAVLSQRIREMMPATGSEGTRCNASTVSSSHGDDDCEECGFEPDEFGSSPSDTIPRRHHSPSNSPRNNPPRNNPPPRYRFPS